MSNFKRVLKILKESVPSHYSSDKEFRQYWKDKGVNNTVTELHDCIRPYDIIVDKDKRKEGLGTQFMTDLCNYADHLGLQIRLSPSADFGATSVTRLKEFYKRFGFVENKGKNKDFTFTQTMYRNPKGK